MTRAATASAKKPRRVRFTGDYRLTQVWNLRLRVVERELLAEQAGIKLDVSTISWESLEPDTARRLIIAMRELYALSNELAYALAYYRHRSRPD